MLTGILLACYQAPDLPLLDEPPLDPRPFTPCDVEDENVPVACVIDGDTVDLNGCGADSGDRIRLLGIDAPETEKPGEPAECHADVAWDYLRDLLQTAEVTVSFDRTCTDPFERTLAYLWLVGDDLDRALNDPELEEFLWSWYLDPAQPAILVNEALLGLGLADAFPEEIAGTLAFQGRLDSALQRAQRSRRGLWGACTDNEP
ncbi:MAG: thermonuclease family protein [Myxococcales bacterium]|nr:thermonuclease family protein [Myxococcales bacterium]